MSKKRLRNMEEFSQATGLSRPTVSKYFHDPGSVRPSTRARIEAALAQFDFRPSFHAMNQNRRKPRTVGVVVPLMTDPFYAELVRRIEIACLGQGHTALVLASHGSPAEEARALDMMLALNIGGVILSPLGRASDARRIEALAREVPLVLLDSTLDVAAPLVACDNRQGLELITRYMAEIGPPPAYLDLAEVNSTAAERRAGYLAAMAALGLEPMVIGHGGTAWDAEAQGRALAEAAFARGGVGGGFGRGGLICGNDRFAIGVLSAACAAGVRVGKGADAVLRLAGHDDHPFAAHTCPALTTVAQDYDGLARAAVAALFAAMESGRPGKGETRLPSRLVRRASA